MVMYKGADPDNSERGGRDNCPLASYIDTFCLFENSIKIVQNFKKKGWARPPRARSTPKSGLRAAFLCYTLAGRSESTEDRQLSLDD